MAWTALETAPKAGSLPGAEVTPDSGGVYSTESRSRHTGEKRTEALTFESVFSVRALWREKLQELGTDPLSQIPSIPHFFRFHFPLEETTKSIAATSFWSEEV